MRAAERRLRQRPAGPSNLAKRRFSSASNLLHSAHDESHATLPLPSAHATPADRARANTQPAKLPSFHLDKDVSPLVWANARGHSNSLARAQAAHAPALPRVQSSLSVPAGHVMPRKREKKSKKHKHKKHKVRD